MTLLTAQGPSCPATTSSCFKQFNFAYDTQGPWDPLSLSVSLISSIGRQIDIHSSSDSRAMTRPGCVRARRVHCHGLLRLLGRRHHGHEQRRGQVRRYGLCLQRTAPLISSIDRSASLSQPEPEVHVWRHRIGDAEHCRSVHCHHLFLHARLPGANQPRAIGRSVELSSAPSSLRRPSHPSP